MVSENEVTIQVEDRMSELRYKLQKSGEMIPHGNLFMGRLGGRNKYWNLLIVKVYSHQTKTKGELEIALKA